MAEDNPVQGLCEEITCSICLEYFKNPVIIGCGHIFCEACITQCWGDSNEMASCPQCRELQCQNFRPVRQLTSIIEIAKKFSLQKAKGAEALGQVCEQHQEPLKLFCTDDEVPICVVCDKSKEHRKHRVIPQEEAFEEYKGKGQTYLKFLKNERSEILSSQQSGKAESQNLLEEIETERQKIVAGFKQLRHFLDQQECHLLAKLKHLNDQIKVQRDVHIASLSAVDLLIKEMEEKQKQPASEFLQDIRNFLERCNKKKFVKPVVFSPGLAEQIEKCAEENYFLDTLMEEFKGSMLAGPQEKKENLTEKEDHTIPTLVLSTVNQTSKNYCNYYPFQHDTHNQFDYWSYVMGVERINSGSYSWVVNVKKGKFWAVGLARECFREGIAMANHPVKSLPGKHRVVRSPHRPFMTQSLHRELLLPFTESYYSDTADIWAVGTSNGDSWYAFTSADKSVPFPWSRNLSHAVSIHRFNSTTIRVSLNYGQDSITFFSVAENRAIHTFHNVLFSGCQISSWLYEEK